MDAWYAAFDVKEGDKLYLEARGARANLVGNLTRPAMPQHLRLVLLVGVVALAACEASRDGRVATAGDAHAVLERYCVGCHNDAEFAATCRSNAIDTDNIGNEADVWERVVRKLKTRTMPPQDEPRPEAETYASFAAWLEAELDRTARPNPGRPALRRLNRAEYGNAIRDCSTFTSMSNPCSFPTTRRSASTTSEISSTFRPLCSNAISRPRIASARWRVGDASTPGSANLQRARRSVAGQHLEGMPLGTVGGIDGDHNFPLNGEYEFRVALLRNNLEGIRGLEHPHQLEITVDGERLLLETVGGDAEIDGARERSRTNQTPPTRGCACASPFRRAARHVAATFVRKIGEGTTRLRPFDRSNADTYESMGRPHVEDADRDRTFPASGAGDTPSRRRIFM